MNQPIRILFILFVFFVSSSSNANSKEFVPLWGTTYYGMSLKEVIASVPNAQTTLNIIKPSFLKPNEQALAKLNNIEIAGETFNVWFIFSNDKLSYVTLILLPKMNDTDALMTDDYFTSLYTHYSQLLIAKYGNPVKNTRQDYAPSNIHLWNTQWIFGLTSIELNEDKIQLEITYSAKYADDLRKL